MTAHTKLGFLRHLCRVLLSGRADHRDGRCNARFGQPFLDQNCYGKVLRDRDDTEGGDRAKKRKLFELHRPSVSASMILVGLARCATLTVSPIQKFPQARSWVSISNPQAAFKGTYAGIANVLRGLENLKSIRAIPAPQGRLH